MSDANHEHESPIKTPKQLIATVVASFVIPITVIALLANYYVGTQQSSGAGSDAMKPESVAERIKPVAMLELKEAAGVKGAKNGETVYKEVCAACHAAGAAGSPKFGDAAAWGPRLGQGYDGLLKSALGGKNAMPPRGGNPDLDDVEVGRAIVYMANASGAKFKEPEAKGGAAAPAAEAKAAEPAAAAPVAAAAPAPAVKAEAAAPAADAGKKVFEAVCITCHGAGVAGAPKFGDKAAWAPRLKQGMDALYTSALKGKGVMPPKGGAANSDDEIKAAVKYMAEAAK